MELTLNAARKPPKLLSQLGAFSGPGVSNPVKGVLPYELITPLYSDGAVKLRHVYVPEGQTTGYSGVISS